MYITRVIWYNSSYINANLLILQYLVMLFIPIQNMLMMKVKAEIMMKFLLLRGVCWISVGAPTLNLDKRIEPLYHFNFFLLYKTFKAKKLCIWKCWIIRLEPFSKNFIDFTGIYLYIYQRGRNVTKDRATLQVFSCEVCKFFWNSYSADCVRGVVKTNINI